MPRSLADGQLCRIHAIDVDTGEDQILHESHEVLYEAPNWTADGRWLIVNGDGHLFRLAADGGGTPERIDLPGVPPLNNDHVLHPDGRHVLVSAEDGHVYRAPLTGGRAERVTPDDGRLHFLHGVSPDSRMLAVIDVETAPDGSWGAPDVVLHPVDGGGAIPLTSDEHPDDGAEFTPDGAWILFNSERGSVVPGHAQLFRMRPDGTGLEQLVCSDRVDWFPHTSPDGRRISYVSFPPGTVGHPEDREVILRICGAEGEGVRDLVRLFGGQGTMNVNSWAPDSRRLAYVDYPLER